MLLLLLLLPVEAMDETDKLRERRVAAGSSATLNLFSVAYRSNIRSDARLQT